MRANVIQVYPFNIDKVKLLTMRGAPGERGPKGDPGNFQLDQLVPTNSAAGSIASFADGGNDLPVKDLKVNIQPSQDLHGYSNPWPEGGGKNLIKPLTSAITQNGVTVETTQDGEIWVHGTPDISSGYIQFDISKFPNTVINQTVTVSVNEKTVGVGFVFGSSNGSINLTLSESATSHTGTYTTNAEAGWFRINVRYDMANINKKYKVQLEIGSSATTWQPYSNICPITGWENVKVTRTGRNIYPIPNTQRTFVHKGITFTKNADGTITLSGTATSQIDYNPIGDQTDNVGANVFSVKAGTYTVSVTGLTSGISYIFGGSANTSGIAYTLLDANTRTSTKTTTVEGTTGYNLIRIASGTTVNTTISIQWETGSTATPYEPYTAAEVTIPLGSTVYGGSLDVTTGVLTVDRAMVDLGTLEWTRMQTAESGYYRFLSNDTLTKPNAGNTTVPNYIICSNYEAITPTQSYTLKTGITITAGATGGKAYVYDSNYSSSTVQQFTSAMSGVALVYELITPTTVQLTPAQLNTLLGVNNIWSDAGGTSVEYYADTKLYIDLAGQTEDDMTANANIASGRYFQIGNTLYISTAAIAAGETIVPGTNCRKTTIAEALNALL